MATFTAIKNKKQTAGVLGGVLKYVQQEKKTRAGGLRFFTGHNCVPQSAYTEMVTTKQRFKKTDNMQFYHFVQSFAEADNLTPQEANAIGLELIQREFPDFEVVGATHLDTNHLHNHLVVNSVSCESGRKLHQSADDLLKHRQAVGFRPGSAEPDEGWLGEMANGIIQLGRSMERLDDIPPLPAPPTWTDNKQRRREALKKLAMGQKLTADTHSQGMSM